MPTEEGLVVRSCGGSFPTVLVRTSRSAACKSCSSRKSCSGDSGMKDIEIEVSNSVGASLGDVVLLNIAAAPLLKATFLVYIFPILSMIFGLCLGNILVLLYNPIISSHLPALSTFLFLILSFVVIRIVGNRLSNKPQYKPEIIRIIRRSKCNGIC